MEKLKNKFKVGDFVKGTKNAAYGITNEKMKKAIVIKVCKDNSMEIMVLKHTDKRWIRNLYNVEMKYFEKYEEPKKEVSDLLIKHCTDSLRCFKYTPFPEELKGKSMKSLTKDDLKERYLVETREGKEYVVDVDVDSRCKILSEIEYGRITGWTADLDFYKNDLSHDLYKERDIVKVWKPEYKCIWERKDKVEKTITKEELTKLLGYEVDKITLPNGEWVSLKED